jgi:hypothetical protein
VVGFGKSNVETPPASWQLRRPYSGGLSSVSSTEKSNAPAHPSTEEQDDTIEAHYASLEREPEACLCYDGWHFLGHVVELADGDEEIEYIRVPCRSCNA